MRLQLTHRLSDPRFASHRGDAVGAAGEPLRRFFVPGHLPCGECGLCRRGLVAHCLRRRSLETFVLNGTPTTAVEVEVPERFVCLLDEPAVPDLPDLASEMAVAAGLVAEVIEAMARAGVGAGQLVLWLGDGLLGDLGAHLCEARGCRVIRISSLPPPASYGLTGTHLSSGDPVSLRREVARAAEISDDAAHRVHLERRLFLTTADLTAVDNARALSDPGSTLTLLIPLPETVFGLGSLPTAKVLTGPLGHPDFVPEALAYLRGHGAALADLLYPLAQPV